MSEYIKHGGLVAAVFFGSLVLTTFAEAASFDCAKAQLKVEHTICDNTELSRLDDELSAVYKAALKDRAQAEAIKQAQKQWIAERNGCSVADCVKRAYEARLLLLRPVIAAAVISSVHACNAEDQRSDSNIYAQDIAGLYRQPVEGLPAYIGRPEEKRSGYNYLAITPLAGNRIRVRLSTKEINGHDCGFDSEALLCGQSIRLMPSEEERSTLELRKQPVPRLYVTTNQIAFIPDADGTFVWGSPYCGAMGYLRQSFSRDTKKLKFDNAIFNQ